MSTKTLDVIVEQKRKKERGLSLFLIRLHLPHCTQRCGIRDPTSLTPSNFSYIPGLIRVDLHY